MSRDHEEILRAQVANAAGDRLHNVIGDATLTAASEISATDAFVSLHFGAKGWKRRRSLLPDQPDDGFTVRGLHRQFMQSAPHRANILDPRMRQVGVGIVRRDGALWVTEVFRDPH